MKRASLILFFLATLAAGATEWINITTNFVAQQIQDSFDFSQFGNGDGCFREAQLALYNPSHFGYFFCNSQSGAGNELMLTNNDSMYGMVPWSMAQSNQVITWFNASGNGNISSNQMRIFVGKQLQAPTFLYDRFGNFTNDWVFPTNNLIHVLFGDYPYYTVNASPGARDYSWGGSNAAFAAGWPYVERWTTLATVVSNAFAAGDHLYQGTVPGTEDHPRFPLQFLASCTYWDQEGVDTNTFTAVVDWNSTTVSTNHCVVSGYSKSGNALAFTLRADRQAPSMDVGQFGFTNDCRHAFGLVPARTNQFLQMVRVLNMPDGNYDLSMDGVVILHNVSGADLRGGVNIWLCYNSPLFQQGLSALSFLRILRDINPLDASSDYTNGNYLNGDLRSNDSAVWSTNSLGNTHFMTTVVSNRAGVVMNFCDTMIHPAVQQTNHAMLVAPITTMTGSNAAVGSLIISQSPTLIRDATDIYLWHIVFPPGFDGSNYVWAPEVTTNVGVKFHRPAIWRWESNTIIVAQQTPVALYRLAGVTNTDP